LGGGEHGKGVVGNNNNKKKTTTTAYGWHITPSVFQTSGLALLKIRFVFGIVLVY